MGLFSFAEIVVEGVHGEAVSYRLLAFSLTPHLAAVRQFEIYHSEARFHQRVFIAQ
jgi:hypothetical protein